jgi:hypothetical protein
VPLSKITAVCSWRARVAAAVRPAGPPPMITTSIESIVALEEKIRIKERYV